MEFELRDVMESDFDWLYELRAQTMSKYIMDSGDQFIQARQADRIRKAFQSIKIVRLDDEDIGMFKVERGPDKWHIIQIQLLPKYQRLGIGTKLIEMLLEEASQQKMPVFLSVLKVNPAKNLYERLGFEVFEEKEKSYTMCYCA